MNGVSKYHRTVAASVEPATRARPKGMGRLTGQPFDVTYSAGFETRAQDLAKVCTSAYRFFAQVLKLKPQGLKIVVASESDWSRYTTSAYGVSNYVPKSSTLVLPATEADFYEGFAKLLSPREQAKLKAVYGTKDGRLDLSRFKRLSAVHELAHAFQQQQGFKYHNLWITELFAILATYAYVAQREPGEMRQLMTAQEAVCTLKRSTASDGEVPNGPIIESDVASIALFGRPRSHLDYVYVLSRLQMMAKGLYDKGGIGVLTKMWNAGKDLRHTKTEVNGWKIRPTDLAGVGEDWLAKEIPGFEKIWNRYR